MKGKKQKRLSIISQIAAKQKIMHV